MTSGLASVCDISGEAQFLPRAGIDVLEHCGHMKIIAAIDPPDLWM